MEQFADRRRREREKYMVLRFYAKTLSVLSYFSLIIVLFASLVLLFGEMSLLQRIFYSVLMLLGAGTYFVILQSTAQAIYLLFDVARNSKASRDMLEKTALGTAASSPPASGG